MFNIELRVRASQEAPPGGYMGQGTFLEKIYEDIKIYLKYFRKQKNQFMTTTNNFKA